MCAHNKSLKSMKSTDLRFCACEIFKIVKSKDLDFCAFQIIKIFKKSKDFGIAHGNHENH